MEVKTINGTTKYYLYGNLHRIDGPAVEGVNEKEWYLNGKRHRVDGPACEHQDGSKDWYFDGQFHRIGGPAIEWCGGSNYWYVNGKKHRLDGPAVESVYGKEWFVDDKLHRIDGPAIEGEGKNEWWVDGVPHRSDDLPAKRWMDELLWQVRGKRHRDFGLPSYVCGGECGWWWEDLKVDKGRSFELAINLRKIKFGLIILLVDLIEDDLFVLVRLNWK